MPNRLKLETSPYLQQHANNPVDWFPWGEEAFRKAREENKVVLVSIGYSSCHWCHVMEHESFDDPVVADYMNKHFVNIKVDREERPDIDQIYMDAVQAISGSGGWPLNVFLTPEKIPFFGGTYYPPHRAYNRISWREVLQNIHDAWLNTPEEILQQAGNLLKYLQNANQTDIAHSYPTAAGMLKAADQVMKQADREWGGFGRAPKFPQTMTITWLLRQYHFMQKQEKSGTSGDSEALLDHALVSLDRMHKGGIYDHLGGGFARYSVDALWHAPHFEKMLYDNALLISAYVEGWKLSQKKSFRQAIHETIGFVLRDWLAPDGGFYSAYDADSEGTEGLYYTWEKSEIEALLNEELAALFCDHYHVTEKGNWEETNILWLNRNGWPDENTNAKLEEAKKILLEHRQNRIKPLLDDKIILSWNAMMLTAMLKAWQVWPEREWMEAVNRTVNFIEEKFKNDDGGYVHHVKDKHRGVRAFLDDLAEYGLALCELSETTGELKWLDKVQEIVNYIETRFAASDSVFFHFADIHAEDLILQKKELYDGATPAANSSAAHLFWKAGKLLGKREWIERSEAMVAAVTNAIEGYPTSFANWGMLAQFMAHEYKELVIIGPEAESSRKEILKLYRPEKCLLSSKKEVVEEKYPQISGKLIRNNRTTYYVCEDFVCKNPLNSLQEALHII